MGKQSLYNVEIGVEVDGYGESDSWTNHFGFRKIHSEIDSVTGGRYIYNLYNALIRFFFGAIH